MLTGKTAIITGGTRGIGKAIALKFASEGASVLLTYASNDDAAEETLAAVKKTGANAHILKGDVSKESFASEAVDYAKDKFEGVDILVNNAGITRDGLLIRMKDEDFNDVVRTNLNGAFYMLKAASLLMTRKKYGRIINISSLVGLRGNAGQVNYAASKAGIIGMTYSAAKELGRRNITVNAIAPGFIETDMTGELTDEQKERAFSQISLGRGGVPEDVANLAAFLASDEASYITGQVIGVDGGMII